MIIKSIVALSGIAMAVLLAATVLHGRRLHREGRGKTEHVRFARRSFWMMLVLIFGAEAMVRMSTGYKINALFITHFSSAALFAISFILIYRWVTGEKNKKIHRFIAYSCCFFFLIMAVTGGILMAGLKLR